MQIWFYAVITPFVYSTVGFAKFICESSSCFFFFDKQNFQSFYICHKLKMF